MSYSLYQEAAVSGDLAVTGGLKAVQRLAEQIVLAAAECEVNPREVFQVQMALDEALTNAVKHGNGDDSKKAVYVVYEVGHEGVSLTIRDEGEGFDHGSVSDPTSTEGLDQEAGRGIYLMRTFMDSVAYTETGNSVTLVKRWS